MTSRAPRPPWTAQLASTPLVGTAHDRPSPVEKQCWRLCPPYKKPSPSQLHRATIVELVLIVLDYGRHRLERQVALGVLDHVLQVEVLDREVVVAILVRPAHRFVVGLAHLGAHRVLLAEVALDRH